MFASNWHGHCSIIKSPTWLAAIDEQWWNSEERTSWTHPRPISMGAWIINGIDCGGSKSRQYYCTWRSILILIIFIPGGSQKAVGEYSKRAQGWDGLDGGLWFLANSHFKQAWMAWRQGRKMTLRLKDRGTQEAQRGRPHKPHPHTYKRHVTFYSSSV